MRLEARERSSRLAVIGAPVGAIVATLAVSALLITWAGAPVLASFAALLEGGFGTRFALTETLTRATPLVLTGLAAAVAFRARFFNIGAEGQLYLGALAAVAVGGEFAADLPAPLAFAAMIAAAIAAGSLWLAVAALLRTRLAVDEVVTTLLTNFVVMLFVSWMLDGPMKDPAAMGWPQSVSLPAELELSKLVARSRLHSGFVVALGCALSLWALSKYTAFGFETRAVGANAQAARFAGINVGRTVLKTALLSGGLAGLAGAIEVAGRTSYVTLDMSPGYGYAGIVVAMLAGLHPLGIVPAAIFIAGMFVGADSMSRAVGVPTFIADVIVAVALIAVLVASQAMRYRIRWH